MSRAPKDIRHPDIYNAIFLCLYERIGVVPPKSITEKIKPAIKEQIERAFNEDSGKQRVHILPQYAEELAKRGCPYGLRDSLLLHTLPDGSGKKDIAEMDRHPAISPERYWPRGQAFSASGGRLVIGPVTYFFPENKGKEITVKGKKITTITACAPNLSGRSSEDILTFTDGNKIGDKYANCHFTGRGLELYKNRCKTLADFIVSSAKNDGKSELIMPDFGLGLYINALTEDAKNQAREAMLTAFSEASKKYDIHISWILYSGDTKTEALAQQYNKILGENSTIFVERGDIFAEIANADESTTAVLNPGSERTVGGDYENTGAKSLEEIIADSSTLLGVSAAIGGANLPVLVSQSDGTYSDMGVTVATFDKVVKECAFSMKRELLINALTDFHESYLKEPKSSEENGLIIRIEEMNEDTPVEDIQTLAEAVTGYIQEREYENTERIPLLEKFIKALRFGISEASVSATEAKSEKKAQLIQVLNDFKAKYAEKLPPEKKGFFSALTEGHRDGKALIKRIDKLENMSFSDIQTLAHDVTKHIEERQNQKGTAITSGKEFEEILGGLKGALASAKPGAAASAAPSTSPSPRR